jgi:hypothetical protein
MLERRDLQALKRAAEELENGGVRRDLFSSRALSVMSTAVIE